MKYARICNPFFPLNASKFHYCKKLQNKKIYGRRLHQEYVLNQDSWYRNYFCWHALSDDIIFSNLIQYYILLPCTMYNVHFTSFNKKNAMNAFEMVNEKQRERERKLNSISRLWCITLRQADKCLLWTCISAMLYCIAKKKNCMNTHFQQAAW